MTASPQKPTSREWKVWSSDAHTTARRVTRDPELAGDLAQEALMLLLRCYSQVRDLHNWLLVVMRRLASKRATRARRRPRAVPAASGPGDFVSPEPFASLDRELDFARALATLPARQARILELAFAGHSHAEMAKALGCEVHQVGPRLHRAYRALGRRLGLEVPPGPSRT